MMTFFKNWRIGFLFFIILTLITASCSNTRRSIGIEEGWELLGESKVNFIKDQDQIDVNNSNRFTAIRFKVEKRNIRLKELHIVYQNGDKLAPLVSENIVADQYSRDIELSLEGKSIRSINFNYRTTGNILKGRANVLVFGKRYIQPVIYTIPIQQ